MGAYQLKNEELTLTVISAGAEMKSLKDNKTEQEYLWQADPKFWGRTSPVLFPIVGNYVQKQSVYEGKTYTLSQHGFARDMEFDLESQTENEIWFMLKDIDTTLEKYPFHFALHIGYGSMPLSLCRKYHSFLAALERSPPIAFWQSSYSIPMLTAFCSNAIRISQIICSV